MRVQENILIVEEYGCAEQHTCECCGTYLGESSWTELVYHNLHPVYNATAEHVFLPEMKLENFCLYFGEKKVQDYDERDFYGRIPSQLVIRQWNGDYWRFVCGFDLPSKGGYWLGYDSNCDFEHFWQIEKFLSGIFDKWEIFLEEPFTRNV